MKKAFSILLLIILLSCSGNPSNALNSSVKRKNALTTQYVEHAPILITHDDNFTQQGFQGAGNDKSPFLIQNLKISAASGDGINISYVTKSFVIENCIIEAPNNGISLFEVGSNTNHFVIRNTLVNNSFIGIYLSQSSNIILADNNCTYNDGAAIKLDSATDCILEHNILRYNMGIGLLLKGFNSNANITLNIIYQNSDYGIYLKENTESSMIYKNIFYWNGYSTLLNAYDAGSLNQWSNIQYEIGNSYSDWDNKGVYHIPGPSASIDFFPTNDTDDDGMPNDFELANACDPVDEDGFLDYDWDGLSNAREYELGTDPNDSDTDDDGYNDRWEVNAGSDPLDPNSTPANISSTANIYYLITLIALPILSLIKKYKREIQ